MCLIDRCAVRGPSLSICLESQGSFYAFIAECVRVYQCAFRYNECRMGRSRRCTSFSSSKLIRRSPSNAAGLPHSTRTLNPCILSSVGFSHPSNSLIRRILSSVKFSHPYVNIRRKALSQVIQSVISSPRCEKAWFRCRVVVLEDAENFPEVRESGGCTHPVRP